MNIINPNTKNYFFLILIYINYNSAISVTPSDFVRAKNRQLIVGSDERLVVLRGVNFVNDAGWLNYSNLFLSQDHSESDYKIISDMGMNTVRFMVDYDFFVDDNLPYIYRKEGWDLLDTNLSWARKNGIFLILDMQLAFGSTFGPGNPVWFDSEKRKRLKSLWLTIADRYKNDTAFVAFDILNEPFPPDSHQQWTQLAQEIIDTIRTIDNNHLIIVQESFGAQLQSNMLSVVNDNNVMYDFHFYYPHTYTHQFETYANKGDGGYYPDSNSCVTRDFMGADPPWVSEIYTGSLLQGNSNWTFYSSGLYKSTDSLIVDAVPFFKCKGNSGCAYFDDFILEEFDSQQNLIRKNHFDIDTNNNIWTLPLIDTLKSFYNFWFLYPNIGYNGSYSLINEGHIGNYAISICGTTNYLSLANDNISYKIKPNHYYRMSGWMKGDGVTGDSCSLGLGLQKLNNYNEFLPFTKEYLKKVLLENIKFSQINNVPINIGEFGLTKYCFMDSISSYYGNRGGLQWVKDVIDLFEENNLNFQYFAYHSWSFGLYTNSTGFPDTNFSNKKLIEYFTSKFNSTPTNFADKKNINKTDSTLNISINGNNFIFDFSLYNSSKIAMEVFSSSGQKIISISENCHLKENCVLYWKSNHLPAGLYFAKITIDQSETKIIKFIKF